MDAKKRKVVVERRPRPPAGCLAQGDSPTSGDENTESFVAPEYKAMETKGIPLAGKITLAQYEELVSLGYDGDLVRKWTQYHADKELKKRSSGRTLEPSSVLRPLLSSTSSGQRVSNKMTRLVHCRTSNLG